MYKLVSILLLIALSTAAAAQDNDVVDSLRRQLAVSSDVKTQATLCYDISNEAYDADTVVKYAQKALILAGGLGLKEMARCYSNMGWGYFIKRDFVQSLDKYQRSVALYERLVMPEEAAMIYINIAACHRYIGDYKQMWENLYLGLDKASQACDTANICYAYSEMADVYQNQKMGSVAQEMLLKAFALAEQAGNYAEMGVIAKELGGIVEPADIDIEAVKASKDWAMKAEGFFSKVEPLDHYYEAIRYNNYAEIIYCYLSLAKFYYDDRYIDSSRSYVDLFDQYANASTVMDEKITDLHIHARQLLYEHKYRQAINMLNKCVDLSNKEPNHYLSNITFNLLVEAYECIGDYKNALIYLNKYCEADQSFAGADAVMQSIAYNVRHKIDSERRKTELENQLAKERQDEHDRHKKRAFAAIVAVGFAAVSIVIIMLVFWFVSKRAVSNIAKRNVQILSQQAMINEQKKELQETTDKIRQSMMYARRIQMSTTSNADELAAVFPGSIVVYQPQEIVSGDWYVVSQLGRQRIVAVGGSSEHGVPGAMACMLVVDSLKETINQIAPDADVSPSQILLHVENKVRNSLGAGVEIAISLCVIDDNRQLKFAAINNDAILVHNDTAHPIIANKREVSVALLDDGDYLFLYSNNTRRLMSTTGSNPETLCITLAARPDDAQRLAVSAITGGQTQSGDITIVGVKG